jgi:precorrin-2/cobalt-factor-2 C20-methyltransferase
MSGRLIGVGVGPGDPELITLKALRALRGADRVFVPRTDASRAATGPGRAERIVAPHVEPQRLERLLFAMGDEPARGGNWDRAGETIAAVVRDGATAAFATIGDPNVYSTFTYVAHTVRGLVPDVRVETVPGIMAMQDLASRSGTVLVEGDESLTLLPYTAEAARLPEALAHADTVVVYKGGRHLERIQATLAEHERLDDAVYGEQLGLEREQVQPAGAHDGRGPYMSTVIVAARRDGVRGGRLR